MTTNSPCGLFISLDPRCACSVRAEHLVLVRSAGVRCAPPVWRCGPTAPLSAGDSLSRDGPRHPRPARAHRVPAPGRRAHGGRLRGGACSPRRVLTVAISSHSTQHHTSISPSHPTYRLGPAISSHPTSHTCHILSPNRITYRPYLPHVTCLLLQAPSTLFENFAWDPAVLCRWARHHQTGKPLSHSLASQLRFSRDAFVGIETQRQVCEPSAVAHDRTYVIPLLHTHMFNTPLDLRSKPQSDAVVQSQALRSMVDINLHMHDGEHSPQQISSLVASLLKKHSSIPTQACLDS